VIGKVQKLEKAVRLPLKIIVCSGDFHHLFMRHWLKSFPDIKVYQSGLKFPNTRNGKEILDEAKEWNSKQDLKKGYPFKDRIILISDANVPFLHPDLAKYQETVQFFGFDQFFIYKDEEWNPVRDGDSLPMNNGNVGIATNWRLGKDGAKVPPFNFMFKMVAQKMSERFLAVWFYHAPSKTLVTEHNWDFYITKQHKQEGVNGFLMKKMLPVDSFSSTAKGPVPKGPTELAGCEQHCKQMARILELDVRAATDYHSWPGQLSRRWQDKNTFYEDFFATLRKTGEHDPTGRSMLKAMTKKQCFCC